MASVGLSATQDLVSPPNTRARAVHLSMFRCREMPQVLQVSSGFTSPVATAGRWVLRRVGLRT